MNSFLNGFPSSRIVPLGLVFCLVNENSLNCTSEYQCALDMVAKSKVRVTGIQNWALGVYPVSNSDFIF